MVDGKRAMGRGQVEARLLNLRPPGPGVAPAALNLHARELGQPPAGCPGTQSRPARRSVERYHRVFLESPDAATLVAVEDRGVNVVGFLL